jgi:hypothetical protein
MQRQRQQSVQHRLHGRKQLSVKQRLQKRLQKRRVLAERAKRDKEDAQYQLWKEASSNKTTEKAQGRMFQSN